MFRYRQTSLNKLKPSGPKKANLFVGTLKTPLKNRTNKLICCSKRFWGVSQLAGLGFTYLYQEWGHPVSIGKAFCGFDTQVFKAVDILHLALDRERKYFRCARVGGSRPRRKNDLGSGIQRNVLPIPIVDKYMYRS